MSRGRVSSRSLIPSHGFGSSVEFRFTEDNVPNPGVLLSSLRQAGYSLETAVGDLVDNPIDADADMIVVAIEKVENDWVISIADNGSGMDRASLDEMMRLGSHVDHDLSRDLGAFGVGSTTASLSLGRLLHVVTCREPGGFWSAATDLDTIIAANRFVKHLDEAAPWEVDLWRSAFERWGLPVPETGTLVRITRCDRVGRTHVAPAVASLKKFIGSTYRYFINAGRIFYVNGEPVPAVDPLARDDHETTILFDEVIEYTFPKSHPRAGETEKFGIVLVQLRDWGGIEANQQHGNTPDRAGFYIMRNRREVVAHTSLNLFSRHPELSRFRGELLFPGTMDSEVGISFLKSNWDIKLSQSLYDKIKETVVPYIRQARRNYRKSHPVSEDPVPHHEAAQVIKQRAPFLRKPTTTIERRDGSSPNGVSDEPRDGAGRARNPQEPRTQKALADVAEFQVRDDGPYAPFFEANLIGRKIQVVYNLQHPFYQRFILDNLENQGMIAAIDYLVYSMASAELRAVEEGDARLIARMREDMSFNLRQLLST